VGLLHGNATTLTATHSLPGRWERRRSPRRRPAQLVILGACDQSPPLHAAVSNLDGLGACGDPASCRGPAGPAASYSGWYQPAPMPSSNRPPDTRSRLAASCARTAGCRKSLDNTIVPSRSRVVTAAAAASPVNGRQLLPERARREMIPQQQHVDPRIFDLTREIEPPPAFPHRLADDPETQLLHGRAQYRVAEIFRQLVAPRHPAESELVAAGCGQGELDHPSHSAGLTRGGG
jgi:hypothetical protein